RPLDGHHLAASLGAGPIGEDVASEGGVTRPHHGHVRSPECDTTTGPAPSRALPSVDHSQYCCQEPPAWQLDPNRQAFTAVTRAPDALSRCLIAASRPARGRGGTRAHTTAR